MPVRRKTYRRSPLNLRRKVRRAPGRFRKNGPGKSKLLILRNPQIVPDRVRVNLTYSDYNYVLTSTTGSYAEFLFKGNSAFDPDQTGAGHQPLGYDQWKAFYNRYRVWYSTIKVDTAVPGSANASSQMLVCLYPTSNVGGSSTMAQALEQPYSKYIQTTNGINGMPHTLFHRANTAKFLGYKDIDDSDDLQAQITADPNHLWYWSISGTTSDGSSTGTILLTVKMVMCVEFFDRINLAQS